MDASRWLVLGLSAALGTVPAGGSAMLEDSLTLDSNGADTSASGLIQDGIPVAFSTTLGSLNTATAGTAAGRAQMDFTAGSTTGTAILSARVDKQTVATVVRITPWGTGLSMSSLHRPALGGLPAEQQARARRPRDEGPARIRDLALHHGDRPPALHEVALGAELR